MAVEMKKINLICTIFKDKTFVLDFYVSCHLVFWSQEAVHQTVRVIFEDPGVQELLVKLYQKGIFLSAGLIFVDLLMCE